MNILLAVVVIFGPAFEVTKGTIVREDGTEVQVGPGTFIPAPYSIKLAKEIVDLRADVKVCQVRLQECTTKYDNLNSHYLTTDKKHRSANRKLQLKLLAANSWFNRWGKIVLACVVVGGATAFVTWEVAR